MLWHQPQKLLICMIIRNDLAKRIVSGRYVEKMAALDHISFSLNRIFVTRS